MLNNENFKDILSKNEKTLILITGDGCANCVSMMPIVNEVAKKYENLKVYTIDATLENQDLIAYYNVEQVPTILLLNGIELISKIKGYQPLEVFELYLDSKM